MAKNKSASKSLSKKSESKNKKRKKLSSRKALLKFAKSETLQPETRPKPKLAKDISSDQSIKESYFKSSAIEPAKDTQKLVKTDVSGCEKMAEDTSAAADAENVTTSSVRSNKITDKSHKLSLLNTNLLSSASVLLAIATGIAILFAIIMVMLPGGKDAVPAMGGVLEATAPLKTAQIVFFLDILFPITFGAGFALLATAFQTRGNRPIVQLVLTALLIVVLADFSENALVFKVLASGETQAVQWPLTVIKYAMLGLSAVMLSCLVLVQGVMGNLVLIFLRFIFPTSVALLLAGIGGRVGSDIIGATFPFGLLLLAIYAKTLSSN